MNQSTNEAVLAKKRLRAARERRCQFRPQFELLEDRLVPALLVGSGFGDEAVPSEAANQATHVQVDSDGLVAEVLVGSLRDYKRPPGFGD
jgi:hypothetical protein